MATDHSLHRPVTKPDFLAKLRLDVQDLLHCHGSALSQAGRPFLSGVDPQLKIDLQGRGIQARVKTGGVPAEVSFVWDDKPEAGEPMTDIVCSCPTSLGFDLCKHTWAVTSVLFRELSQENSPLTRALKGGDQNAWKNLLNPLDRFLQQTRTPHNYPPETPTETAEIRRLVYKFEVERGHLVVNAYEQFVLKNGGWGKGRKMIWSRLAGESPAELGPIDQQVCAAAQRRRLRRHDEICGVPAGDCEA